MIHWIEGYFDAKIMLTIPKKLIPFVFAKIVT